MVKKNGTKMNNSKRPFDITAPLILRKPHHKVMKAIQIMQKIFATNPHLTTRKIARSVGMAEAPFHILFKKEMKITPMTFLTLVRIQRAKTFLNNTSLSFREVALRSGFKNYNSFPKHFQRLEGMSPTQYLKMAFYRKFLEMRKRV